MEGRGDAETRRVMEEPLAIRTENLTRIYRIREGKGRQKKRGELVALDRVNLQVRQGELFGLLGPNGAGKTTLIKILTTLLSPTSGRAWVDGLDVERDVDEIRRRINMVSGGETSGYGLLTVQENLWMFAQFYGMDRRTTRQRMDELLEMVGLADRRHTKISDLSTGLRQKMNVVRGFLTDPRIIFLDEPTLGLDVGAARQVRSFIANWLRERPERTVLLTTHYMVEADELCDRVAIIDHGQVLACDTPSHLKRSLSREAIYHIRVSPFPQELAPSFHLIEGVRQFTPRFHDGHVHLDFILEEDDVLTPVVDRISRTGARILSLEKREPTLEDVFMSLVGRGLTEEHPGE